MERKEIQKRLVETLKRWQKIEEEAVLSTDEVIATATNPILRTIFEIVHRDAQNHRRVHEVIIRGHEAEGFRLSVEELEELSKVISRHVQVEKRMFQAARDALGLIKGKKMILHEYFLNYLLDDEKKHTDMLKQLENLKRLIPASGPAA
jgi:hypothetical protein